MDTWDVKIGIYSTSDALHRALADAGVKITGVYLTTASLARMPLSPSERTVSVAVVSLEELGLQKGVTLSDIRDAANKQGFDPCPAEVAAYLCLQDKDLRVLQPGKWLTIISEPILCGDGSLGLLCVERDVQGVVWLNSYSGDPNRPWVDDDRFVFVPHG